jgi:hypothetical protein
MLEDVNFLAEMDALFGKSSTRIKPKPVPKPTPKPLEPEYWQPQELQLHLGAWQCSCGACGTERPRLFLLEQKGKFARLRAVESRTQANTLPRSLVVDEPVQIDACETCFDSSPIGDPQLLLFAENIPLDEFRRSELRRLLDLADEQRNALKNMRRGLTVDYDAELTPECNFPHTVDFDLGSHKSRHHFNQVTSDLGPVLPHYEKE